MSPRHASTHFGEPLSVESKKLVNDVRDRLSQPIDANFDSDFNVYRFILNAERGHKNRRDIVESASKALNEHLKVRKCMNLDELPDMPFEENRLFKERFLPCGLIRDTTDSDNRLLWFIEYATISIEGIANAMRSSESIRWQFRQFEHMLRRVNKQEEATGRLSSLRHIVDMNGYEINPFTMLFVSSGTLSYYSQLFHYDNYPELVNPIELVNIAKWIHVPYKLFKTMMPAGFSDRFRLHDGNFLQHLANDVKVEDIPISLGGENKDVTCTPANKSRENAWEPSDHDVIKALETLSISPRKLRYFRAVVEKKHQILSWYYRTDGDFYFSVFYEPFSKTNGSTTQSNGHAHNNNKAHHHQTEKELDLDSKELVHPWLKLSAKLVDENDAIDCASIGVYYVIFSNKQSWLHSRTVDAMVMLSDPISASNAAPDQTPQKRVAWRCRTDGSCEECDVPNASHFPTLADVAANARSWRALADRENSGNIYSTPREDHTYEKLEDLAEFHK